MKAIGLYWWRPRKPGKINLGDEISGKIVEFATGRPVVHAPLPTCDLLAIGSVLAAPMKRGVFAGRSEPIHVWGSGLLSPVVLDAAHVNYAYHAVRGPLTRCLAEAHARLPLGDPGILAAQIWPPAREKRFSWGLIPHHSQVRDPAFRRLRRRTRNCVLIDFTAPDVAATIKLLTECERIASNGLHGLILADSYGIPNYWIDSGVELHGGKSWKFYDYFASIGRARFEPISISTLDSLERITTSEADVIHFRNVEAAQAVLLKARPMI